MPLKARKPEIHPNPRLKFLISGKSGVGKTYFALNFPKPYFIDTEGGAKLKEYQEKLIAADGAYMGVKEGAQDFYTIIDEIKELATVQHDYKTLIIDSFSKVYLTYAAIKEEKVGYDFNRDRKEANRPSRQLMRWLEQIDMNVILICHQKDKWEKKPTKDKQELVYSGTTYDGYDKIEFDLDLWIEVEMLGKERFYNVKKSRLPMFPVGEIFALDYKKFVNFYGEDTFNKSTSPITFATQEEIDKLTKYIEILNRPTDEVQGWKVKLNISDWKEATSEQVRNIISILEEKIKEIQK